MYDANKTCDGPGIGPVSYGLKTVSIRISGPATSFPPARYNRK